MTSPGKNFNHCGVKTSQGMHNKQAGATLITALIMLVVLTLLVVSGIRSSTINLRIAGNMQQQEEVAAATQQAIENVLSSTNFKSGAIAAQTVGNYTVTFAPPVCLSAQPALGNAPGTPRDCQGDAGEVFCYWTTWDITGIVVDTQSGARTEIHQGVSLPVNTAEKINLCGN